MVIRTIAIILFAVTCNAQSIPSAIIPSMAAVSTGCYTNARNGFVDCNPQPMPIKPIVITANGSPSPNLTNELLYKSYTFRPYSWQVISNYAPGAPIVYVDTVTNAVMGFYAVQSNQSNGWPSSPLPK